ncbi:MAG: DNA cytosine methyltransferase [Rhodanobacteraceae bacterium]|nr:DNA cytosine methyltransferase [Rhodanobacteraceae bacterium]
MRKRTASRNANTRPISCVDLFCGAGGLSYGLTKAGIRVAAGVDLDPACDYPYRTNNPGKFLRRDVVALEASELKRFFRRGELRLLAGCAPCQPFSKYSQARPASESADWALLDEFGRLIIDLEPELVTMENVPEIRTDEVFLRFLSVLEGYHVWYDVVDCSKLGMPQSRRRLVLLASKLGPVRLKAPTGRTKQATVKHAIGELRSLEAGGRDPVDRIHVAAGLKPINLARIKQSIPGGTWRDWDDELRARCHTRESGVGYGAVYGRMEWDKPAPTMTTLCYGFGNGRFGHPEQDRAISLREAAILQTFPKNYEFVAECERVHFSTIGRLIGNAVPPRLGEIIGKTFADHVAKHFENVRLASGTRASRTARTTRT